MKAQLYYFDKKKKKEAPLFDKLIRQSQFITRANDPSKTLGNNKIRFLLANIAERLARSKNGEICIDHDFISSITYCKSDQNAKLLAQLADIFKYKYYNFIKFEGQKRSYCYVIKYTETGESRLENPELFYSTCDQFQTRKKSTLKLKKIGPEPDKNQASYKEERDSNEELEELSTRVLSNSKKEIKNKEKSELQSKDLPCLPCGAASLSPYTNQPAKPRLVVTAAMQQGIVPMPSTLQVSRLVIQEGSNTATDTTPPVITAEQEREHYKNHQNRRESSGEQTLGATILSLFPKLNQEVKEVTNAHQKGVDFQPRVENSPSYGTLEYHASEPSMNNEIEAKPEEKPHDLDEEFRQALAHKAERTSVWQGCLRKVAENMGETYDPLSGKMSEVTLDDILCQFGNMGYKVDLKAKCIRLQAKGDLWIPAFELIYSAKFKEAAHCIGYNFELVRTLEEKS